MFILLILTLLIVPTDSQVDDEEDYQRIVYGFPYHINDFSYWTADSYATAHWNSAIHAGLYKRSSEQMHTHIPELAMDMPAVSSDGKVWTIDLKPGLYFDTGNKLTSRDITFSYAVALTPEINRNSYDTLIPWFSSNQSIAVIDDDTISFTLVEKYAFTMELLSIPIIDEEIYEELYYTCVNGNLSACNWNNEVGYHSVGSAGPFALKSIDSISNTVVVRKNPYYWDVSDVWASEIEFTFVETKEGATHELLSGNIDIMDWMYTPLPSDFTDLTGVRATTVGSFYHYELSLNHLHPYFGSGELIPDNGNITDDAEQARLLRLAMSHAVNREILLQEVVWSLGMPATTAMPPASIGHDTALVPHTYDILHARAIMEQIGFDYQDLTGFNTSDPNDACAQYWEHNTSACFFNVTLLGPNTGATIGTLLTFIRDELPKIGIGIHEQVATGWDVITPRTYGWHLNDLNTNQSLIPLYNDGGYDIFHVGHRGGLEWYPDGIYTKSGLCNASGIEEMKCENIYNYVNQTVDNMINKYMETYQFAERIELVRKLQKMLYHELPIIPILYPTMNWAWQADLLGIDPVLLAEAQQDWKSVSKISWREPGVSPPITLVTIPPPTGTPTEQSTTSDILSDTIITNSSSVPRSSPIVSVDANTSWLMGSVFLIAILNTILAHRTRLEKCYL